jgi:hypothetical protein
MNKLKDISEVQKCRNRKEIETIFNFSDSLRLLKIKCIIIWYEMMYLWYNDTQRIEESSEDGTECFFREVEMTAWKDWITTCWISVTYVTLST